MNPRRQAKKILKLYGKAEYDARISYIKGFLPEEPSFVGRIGFRHLGKRCLVIALILTLTLAMAVVTASAFGIQLFGFKLTEWDDHTEIRRDEEVVLEGEARFYEPEYIPAGYELLSVDGFEDQDKWCVYENEEGDYLYIDQSMSDNFTANINNEDCTKDIREVDGVEVLIYRYNDGSGSTWMFTKGKTYCDISGLLSDDEVERIIRGLL